MIKPVTFLVPALAAMAALSAFAIPDQTNAAAPPKAPAAFASRWKRPTICSGFGYSPAMRGSGKVWTAAELDAFLANPTGTIPGTRMVLPVRNAAQRRAIIDYLATL